MKEYEKKMYSQAINYALHALMLLARQNDRMLTVYDIAKHQNVSETYLAKIMAKLTKSGLIISTPGVQGGYRLAKKSSDICFYDVIVAIDGNKPFFTGCKNGQELCEIEQIMNNLSVEMKNFLKNKTIANII